MKVFSIALLVLLGSLAQTALAENPEDVYNRLKYDFETQGSDPNESSGEGLSKKDLGTKRLSQVLSSKILLLKNFNLESSNLEDKFETTATGNFKAFLSSKEGSSACLFKLAASGEDKQDGHILFFCYTSDLKYRYEGQAKYKGKDLDPFHIKGWKKYNYNSRH